MNAHNRLDLIENGYCNRAPTVEAGIYGGDVIRKTPCRKCDGQCYYEPWSKPGSYRAFAICLDCGHEEEF